MGRTQTETGGFGENTRQGLQEVEGAMRKAGYNPDEIDRILAAQIEVAAKANARQEDLKRQLKESTKVVEAETRKLDMMASGYLDAGIAAVGKGSDAAKNLQRIRSRIRLPVSKDTVVDGGPVKEAKD